MPSPDLLPRGRSFPSAVAPPLDDVLKGARRRRTRQAGMVGVVATAAIAAATFAFLPHGSSDSLHSVTPTLPGHSESPAPAGHEKSVDVVRSVPNHAKTTRGVDGPATLQPVTKTKQQPSGNQPLPQPAQSRTSATATATASGGTVGPPHRMTTFDASKGCAGNGPNATTGWCSYYSGALSGVAGRAVTLATSVCRLPGQSTGVLFSNHGKQADFTVGVTSYPAKWRWGRGRTFSEAGTSIRVPAGECVEWYVRWRVVNNAGKPLPSGKYYLDADPDMQPARGYAAAGTQASVDFTVR